ncbi:MAG: flagellar biosynthesis protein FliQ [Eubacterium sp.]|nr:flagellar biosynthesis protein FliQ [Eubacterium sp.]
MTDADVLDIAQDMIFTIIKCAAPLLLVSLIVGLIISIFQTITSIQEQTLTFVPKLLAIFVTILLTGGWIMDNCVEFFTRLCNNFSSFVGG